MTLAGSMLMTCGTSLYALRDRGALKAGVGRVAKQNVIIVSRRLTVLGRRETRLLAAASLAFLCILATQIVFWGFHATCQSGYPQLDRPA